MGLHRAAQRSLPITVAGAGLPSLATLTGEAKSYAERDDSFFRVRSGRTSNGERAYLRAMAELGPGPIRTGAVAELLGKKATAVGPVRESLLRRALCYVPRYGEIAFTVPMYDQYLKRWIPSLASVTDS